MVKKNKNHLNKFERDILRLLDKSLFPLSTNSIAEKLEISYNTASKYIKELENKKLIKQKNE